MLRYFVPRRFNHMLAWRANKNTEIHGSQLELCETRIPTIATPTDVLVKVRATSINPLDVKMLNGYGEKVLDLLDWATNFEPRVTNDRYPLTLGRDFSGEVVSAGPCAKKHFKPGDEVFGVIEPQKSGSHAQFVTTPAYCLTKKPENISHLQAASMPFIALTTYSAISTFGNLNRNNCDNKEVLVIGGSGGVGTFAIQLLKLWGANVTATCSPEKMDWLETELFVDRAVNYNDPNSIESLKSRFNFVLDAGSYDNISRARASIVRESLKFLKPLSNGVYVTLSPPILNNTDELGVVPGIAKTAVEAILDTASGLMNLNSARWAVFLPNRSALQYISSLLKDSVISPQLHQVFNFNQMRDAFAQLESGETRGKVVVDTSRIEENSL